MAKAIKPRNTDVMEIEAEEIPIEKKIEETINTELQKANVTETIIANLKEKYLPLTIRGQEDKETYTTVVEARKDCKKWRILAEKVCKKGREAAVMEQKLWLAKEKDVAGRIGEVETYLEKQETDYETERDRIKAEKRQQQEANYTNRTLELVKMGAEFNGTGFVLGDIEYSASLIRETDNDIYEATILPKYREIFDKNEAVRIETERIKKEQDDELQRQKDELARQQQELADQQRKLNEQQDEADRAAKAIADKAEQEQREKRDALQSKRLIELLPFNKYGADVNMTTLWTLEEHEYNSILVTKKQQFEDNKAKEEKERQEAADKAQQEAVDKALADEKERQRLSDKKKEDDRIAEETRKALELEKAGDAAQWANFIGQVKALTFPTAKSGQYRRMIAMAKEKIEEIQSLKP